MIIIFEETATVILAFVIVVLVLYLCFMFSRRVGTHSFGSNSSAHMKIVERVIVGQDRSILIISVGSKYYLVGISSAGIQMLAEVSSEEMELINPEKTNMNQSFTENFKETFMKKFKK